MLPATCQSLARRFLLTQLPQQPQRLSGTAVYSWNGRRDGPAVRQPRTGDGGFDSATFQPRDHNEIRLRGTVTKIFVANNRLCRFQVTTSKLYRRVNPGGSWRWAESKLTHNVVGAGANLPNYLAVLAVGARVDMSGIVTYQGLVPPSQQPAASPESGEMGDQHAVSAAANTAADRRAVVRMTWLKPVEAEESVEINFDVQLEDQ